MVQSGLQLANGKSIIAWSEMAQTEIARLDAAFALDGTMTPFGVTHGDVELHRRPGDIVAYGARSTFGVVRPDGTHTAFASGDYGVHDIAALGGDAVAALVKGKVNARLADGGVDPLLDGRDAFVIATDGVRVTTARHLAVNGYQGKIEIQRFGSTAIDPSFGAGGTTTLAWPKAPIEDHLVAAVAQPDGRVVLAFRSASKTAVKFLRLTLQGQADPTFGASGVATFTNVGPFERMELDAKGRLVFEARDLVPAKLVIARLLL